MKPLYVVGCPGSLAGADTELWHTIKLWRANGVPVNVIPTWSIAPEWRRKCESVGCDVFSVEGPDLLLDVPGIRDGIAVAFCNTEFCKIANRLTNIPKVWAGCMCWLSNEEREAYGHGGPFDSYVFQSQYQYDCLMPRLRNFGVKDHQAHLIHGALDVTEWPFAPRAHPPGTEFYYGKLSRPDPDKFSANLWTIYDAVPYRNRRVRVMGWSDEVKEKCGEPPAFATVLPPGAESSASFVYGLHAMVPINGGAAENWPRVGLEAMSAGVPLVVENRWGWREMIVHGESGFLCDSEEEMAYWIARLAYDEELRLRVAQNARTRVTHDLAPANPLWSQWQKVFEQWQA